MTLDHRLLHAVQLALMLEVFDTDQLLAVQRRHERQARIEAAITQRLLAVGVTVQLANHDGARTAVATGATFLGTGLVCLLTQVGQHGHVRIQAALGF